MFEVYRDCTAASQFTGLTRINRLRVSTSAFHFLHQRVVCLCVSLAVDLAWHGGRS